VNGAAAPGRARLGGEAAGRSCGCGIAAFAIGGSSRPSPSCTSVHDGVPLALKNIVVVDVLVVAMALCAEGSPAPSRSVSLSAIGS
jgi:hypothetical protein